MERRDAENAKKEVSGSAAKTSEPIASNSAAAEVAMAADSGTKHNDKSPTKNSAHTSRDRSHSRDRKRHRNRSRSRPRERKDSSSTGGSSATANAVATSSGSTSKSKSISTKNFKFGSIALKPLDKTKAGGNGKKTDEEKQRRREKLKLWREQQMKQKSDEAESFLAEVDVVPSQIQLWSLEEEDRKKETPEERQKREEREEEQRKLVQRVVEEVDPLDAYMAGLVDEAAIQQSIVNPAANVISLQEIESDNINIYGTFLPPQINTEQADQMPEPTVTSNSDSSAVEETPEEREAREERELKEFMNAIKNQRAADVKEEDFSSSILPGSGEAVVSEDAAKPTDTGRIYQGFEEDAISENVGGEVDQRSALEILQEAQKKKEIKPVDHSKVSGYFVVANICAHHDLLTCRF